MSALATVLRAPLERRTRRELTFAVVGVVPAVPAFALALVGIVASVLSIVAVGLPVLVGVLALARLTVRWFRPPARAVLGWDWPDPPPVPGRGLGRAFELLRDGVAWRALLYCLVDLPLTLATAYLGVVAVVVGVAGLTFPLWWFVSSDFGFAGPTSWAGALALAAQAAALLLAFPWVLRLLVGTNRFLADRLLAPPPATLRIGELERRRDAIAADAATTLRHIERDLHDGTQARLVSLGVMLARLDGRVADPGTREIVDEARRAVTDALEELRDIIRGMHPPALDHGLGTALATLAARSPVPARFTDDLDRPPTDAEARTLYFSAAELLTNVARHAGATTVELRLTACDGAVELVVRDDGRGGARASAAAGGLAGLRRRAQALDGDVVIDSPDGGPTTISIRLPGHA